MNFNWLKNLFHKKIKESVGITNINSDLTYIPKMNELDKESRKKVMEQYRELNRNNYREKILNYSYDLAQKSYKEIDVLTRTMMKYEAQYEKYRNDRKDDKSKTMVMATDYHLALLSVAEYNSIIDTIFNIRAELTLRLLALDLFIKKENIEYKFKGIINRRQEVEYRTLQKQLEEERGRLLTLITCNDHIFLAVKHNISTKAMLEEKQEIFNIVNQKLHSGGTNIQRIVINMLMEVGEHLTRCVKIIGLNEEFIKDLKEKIAPKIKNTDDIDYIIHDMVYSCNWVNFVDKVDFNNIKDVYKLLGVYYHKYETYRLDHFHDYEKYIKELEEIVKMCETTPPKEWDTKYLDEKASYFTDELYSYMRLFDKSNKLFHQDYDTSIDEENRKKLVELYFKLLLFDVSAKGNNKEKNLNKSYWRTYEYPYSSSKLYKEFCDFRFSYIYDLLTKVGNIYQSQMKMGMWNFYLDQLFDDDGIEINNNLKRTYEVDLRKKLEDPEFYSEIIKDCRSIITGKPLDIEKGFKAYHYNKYGNLKEYIRSIGNIYTPAIIQFDVPSESKDSYVFDIREIKTATDEEIFYIMKTYDVDPEKIILSVSTLSVDKNYLRWIQEIKIKEMEKKYDHRIMVFPKSINISFDFLGREFLPQYTQSNKVGLNSTIENVFVSTEDQFDYVYDICKMQLAPEYRTVKKRTVHVGESPTYEAPNYKSNAGRNLKRIFMTEKLYNSLKCKDFYDIHHKAKIVVIPNINHYYEVSQYLNNELKKEERIAQEIREETENLRSK